MLQSVQPPVFTEVLTGEIAGSTSSALCPNVPCLVVKFKAQAANTGRVYLGSAANHPNISKTDGSADSTTGLQLSAGQETDWLPVSNLNKFGLICDNASDALTYIAFR
jgi:hypothetical protein